jgi:hypothetical protein
MFSVGVRDQFMPALRAMPRIRIADARRAFRANLEQWRAIVRAELFVAGARYGTTTTRTKPKVNGDPTLFDTHLDLLGAVCAKAGQVAVRFEAVFAPCCAERLKRLARFRAGLHQAQGGACRTCDRRGRGSFAARSPVTPAGAIPDARG